MKAGNPNLTLRNRQRARRLDLPLVRRITTTLLRGLMGLNDFDLGLLLVGEAEMARLNQTFLHHAGSTDVLCFDYRQKPTPPVRPLPGCPADSSASLHADIVVCVDEAVAQARRFRTTWQSELVRYIVHGILHLRGFDDRRPAHRRKMKRAEDHFLGQLAGRFDLRSLGGGELRGSPAPARRGCPEVRRSKVERSPKSSPGAARTKGPEENRSRILRGEVFGRFKPTKVGAPGGPRCPEELRRPAAAAGGAPTSVGLPRPRAGSARA